MKKNQSENKLPTPSAPGGLELVIQAWERREGPAVLVTVDADKTPNAIYVGEIRYLPDEGFIVADNFFNKTRANIRNGTKGAILFITNKRKAFQVKGPLSYHTGGPVFHNMRSWHDPKLPGMAATLLRIEEAYSGALKLL